MLRRSLLRLRTGHRSAVRDSAADFSDLQRHHVHRVLLAGREKLAAPLPAKLEELLHINLVSNASSSTFL